MFRRIDERTAEVDARVGIEELNRMMGLSLPDDAGFETLGGFITTTLGLIPQEGATFEHDVGPDVASPKRLIITVLDAEPQRVNRARVEVMDLQPQAPPETPESHPEPVTADADAH